MSRNTEFQFVSTDAAEITNFLITVYENLTGVSVRPASPEKLFAQWVASVIIQERVYNNYTANQNIPSRAEGKNLDALAELYYLQQRPQAKPAYCTERFTISEAQTFAILVPKGTRVTDASNTLIWETVADAYINAGDTYVDTAIRCQTDGTVGNGYAVGQLNVIVDVFDYYTSCTNITTSDDGSEIASDEEFYELMRESMFAFSTAGAVGSYIYHAKSVSTEIADVQAVRPAVVKKVTLDLYTKGGVKYAFLGGDTIDLSSLAVYAKGSSTAASADTDYTVTYENGLLQVAIAADGALASASQIDVSLTFDGAGHVDIYVLMNDGTIATTEIKNAVLAACNESKVRPLADYVSVKDPGLVSYNIDFTYYVPTDTTLSGAAIQEAVDAAVEEYIAWQSGKLGRDINPDKLRDLLFHTGVKRIVLRSPAYKVLEGGKNNAAPQIAKLGTKTIVNGGYEDE